MISLTILTAEEGRLIVYDPSLSGRSLLIQGTHIMCSKGIGVQSGSQSGAAGRTNARHRKIVSVNHPSLAKRSKLGVGALKSP